jgi:hypothetical protein
MKKTAAILALCLVALFACKKKEEAPAPAAETTSVGAAAPGSAPEGGRAHTATPQATVTLAAGAPIPAQGVALWLVADDAQPGKLASWTNPAVAGVTAKADKPEEQPEVVASAIGGHKAVRFDGAQTILMTNVDISPARMPEATIFAVFNSKTDAKEPLRKLYGDDNGGYDRAVGLDGRSDTHNYTAFIGNGVSPYFDVKPNESYVTADVFTSNTFNGYVNGKKMADNVAAAWGANPDDALPNLYLGGTGTVYHEPWQGDLAEIIVYGRVLSDPERVQVEDYLGKKYGLTMAR